MRASVSCDLLRVLKAHPVLFFCFFLCTTLQRSLSLRSPATWTNPSRNLDPRLRALTLLSLSVFSDLRSIYEVGPPNRVDIYPDRGGRLRVSTPVKLLTEWNSRAPLLRCCTSGEPGVQLAWTWVFSFKTEVKVMVFVCDDVLVIVISSSITWTWCGGHFSGGEAWLVWYSWFLVMFFWEGAGQATRVLQFFHRQVGGAVLVAEMLFTWLQVTNHGNNFSKYF